MGSSSKRAAPSDENASAPASTQPSAPAFSPLTILGFCPDEWNSNDLRRHRRWLRRCGLVGCQGLTEGGLKVLLLEAGRNLRHRPRFSRRRGDGRMGIVGRVKAAIQGQQVQARCGSFSRKATKHFYVNDRENPYTMPPGRPFLWIRGRQLGGRLHTWGRHVPRMSNYEFKAASVRGDGIDWPLSYDDLAPYYDIVERTLGVYGKPAGIPNCPDGQFIGPRKRRRSKKRFLDQCRETTAECPCDVREERQVRQR